MFSTTTEYALRALACLAHQGSDTPVTGRELAERAHVSPKYLSAILADLKKLGIVGAARGTGGGYRLTRKAEEIPLAEIIGVFERAKHPSECLLGDRRSCSDRDPCPAHKAWGKVRRAYMDFVDHTTLADISREPLPARRRRDQ